jgi:hypothetical protein
MDLDSGQKKMLMPEGESGSTQKNSLFQRYATKEALGLKDILSRFK